MGPFAETLSPWLEWLDSAIHLEILRLRARYQLSLDEFRGLYISDEAVEQLLRGQQLSDTSAEAWGAKAAAAFDAATRQEGPLPTAAAAFGLADQQAAALAIALASEADAKYLTLFAYLNNDVAKPLPTIDLIRRLTGASLPRESPLFAGRLLLCSEPIQRSWSAQQVAAAPAISRFLALPARSIAPRPKLEAAAWLAHPSRPVLIVEATPGSDPLMLAEKLATDLQTVLIPAPRFDHRPDWLDALLFARLSQGLLYLDERASPVEAEGRPRLIEMLQLLRTGVPKARVVLAFASGTQWRSALAGVDHESMVLAPPEADERSSLWQSELERRGIESDEGAVAEVSRLFALHPTQIAAAGSHLERRGITRADSKALGRAAREESLRSLEGFALREANDYGWDDLMLPESTMSRLRNLADAIRNRDVVFKQWGFRKTSGGQSSLRALFTGVSGTGKTMSTSVIANELGLDLYRIDLSSVVSKYIGETEKNLEQIFRAAEGSNAILFFDEADALFGKRSDVQDAHDRFANIETAYLLQRMEQHDGVMILATNLSKNMDAAFSRRIHFDVEFPMPDEAIRERLWHRLIPTEAPTRDVDYRFLSRQFVLAGGDIRNVALDAAFVAAQDGGTIGMKHLVQALARQRLKQGRIPSASEFKHYFSLIQEEP